MVRHLVLCGVGVALGLTLAVSGCRRGGDGAQTVNLVGSTSVQPFAEMLAQAYEKQHEGRVVKVQGGGSTAGVQAVAGGLAQIGTCSRSLAPEEAKEYTPITIARDGLAIVVNNANPVKDLKPEQLREIFSGKTKNWKEVGGKDEAIRAITREEGSGTRESLQHLVMGKDARISRDCLVQASTGAVKELVKTNPAAIAYMSLGLVDKQVKALAVDGVEATDANILAGKYMLVRPFLFVTKGPPTPAAQAFIDFVLSPDGQKILESEGLIRAK